MAMPGPGCSPGGEADTLLPELRAACRALRAASSPEQQRLCLRDLQLLVQGAWAVPARGRELATGLCEQIRLGSLLPLLLELSRPQHPLNRYPAASLLEQVLTPGNRDWVARSGLGVILDLASDREDVQLARPVSGILQHMFKHTEGTSHLLITNGGLDYILYWCRSQDPSILQHCAIALANCAMYGGPTNQRLMIEKKAADWLFPLAFSQDELVQFHACLAITALATNKELEKEVESSGTLDLVEPFIASLHPEEFAHEWLQSRDNAQGRNANDLQRLVQLLDSSRVEAQCVATFYLCVEADIKQQQKQTQTFHEIGATSSLKRLVSYSSNTTVSRLAKRALELMGEEVSWTLSLNVPNWKAAAVHTWLQQIGFSVHGERFLDLQVDGDLLLLITDSELQEDVGISSSITRRRFLRELRELKTYANYSSCDRSNLADWLGSIDLGYRQYTYNLVHCGIERATLHGVTDRQLEMDCRIETGFHRSRILAAAQELVPPCVSEVSQQPPSEDPDVFISYRRTTGSQLASLLKVHLQHRGFSVFIDVEKLEAGRFEDKLCQSVTRARNFILVLSANCLDKCVGDTEQRDWVHREIVMAMTSKKNIVPVADNFTWPDPDSLPEDMRAILKFNSIMWSHEYQDASIEKILRFLHAPFQKTCPAVPADAGLKAVGTHHG
ncbi:NAD(+) hydrolase SARM1 isoform X1 [Hemiscyllium ocellatum]|uniref:NAD(+) hydrolase SARM1 isoform X1 n=1 Tax=Hemiscyllium ocellatum TaxID=170820 RepID=UPI0029667A51|nr:NAD(+) hydrolase SARM1 isoform X1 [Hemiscyllium ocellatum]